MQATRQHLIFDADDTLWENNVYFEAAFDQFCEFLSHSSLSPVEIREVVNEAARAALSTREPIGHDDILRALNARPPSLKSEDLGKRRIGFSN